jgi:pimeloyl-ACP methyl ester carboxylesterase
MVTKTYHDHTNTHPLPLGRAIRALPAQYLKVITRPSVQSFSAEKGRASWGSTWLQLIALGILSALFSVLAQLIVVGDQDAPEVLEVADTLEWGIAGAKKRVIPDTAHHPHMEKPEEFNRIVIDFLSVW